MSHKEGEIADVTTSSCHFRSYPRARGKAFGGNSSVEVLPLPLYPPHRVIIPTKERGHRWEPNKKYGVVPETEARQSPRETPPSSSKAPSPKQARSGLPTNTSECSAFCRTVQDIHIPQSSEIPRPKSVKRYAPHRPLFPPLPLEQILQKRPTLAGCLLKSNPPPPCPPPPQTSGVHLVLSTQLTNDRSHL